MSVYYLPVVGFLAGMLIISLGGGGGAAYGALGGVMSGLLGVTGGGPITAGLFVLECTPLHAVGTSVFVICGLLSQLLI